MNTLKDDEQYLTKSNCNEKVGVLVNSLIPEEYRNSKFFCVMLFYKECEISDSKSERYVNTRNIDFDDPIEALNSYSNISCPASLLLHASSAEEMERKKQEAIANFSDEKWVKEILEPTL